MKSLFLNLGSLIGIWWGIVLLLTEDTKGSLVLSVSCIIFLSWQVFSFTNKRKSDQAAVAENALQNEKMRLDAVKTVKTLVETHGRTLFVKSEQLCGPDEYGVIDRSKWKSELDRFWRTVIAPTLGPEMVDLDNGEWGYITKEEAGEIIESVVQKYKKNSPLESIKVAELSPIGFEHYCADQLRAQGWISHTTKCTGDQGVDVVATKGKKKVVLQCKLYTYPVGNKAVQECYAAKDFSRADIAVVITNSKFTASAKQLASTLDVILMHHSELGFFDKAIEKYVLRQIND